MPDELFVAPAAPFPPEPLGAGQVRVSSQSLLAHPIASIPRDEIAPKQRRQRRKVCSGGHAVRFMSQKFPRICTPAPPEIGESVHWTFAERSERSLGQRKNVATVATASTPETLYATSAMFRSEFIWLTVDCN